MEIENNSKNCLFCGKELSDDEKNKNYTLRKDLILTGNAFMDNFELIVYIRNKITPVFYRLCEKCTKDKLLWFITEAI